MILTVKLKIFKVIIVEIDRLLFSLLFLLLLFFFKKKSLTIYLYSVTKCKLMNKITKMMKKNCLIIKKK